MMNENTLQGYKEVQKLWLCMNNLINENRNSTRQNKVKVLEEMEYNTKLMPL